MSRKIVPVQPDKFVHSEKVMGLLECNFFEFLNDKQSALVMFYNPNCANCLRSRGHYARAAKFTKRDGHAYAAVDCTTETDLCKREGISRLPTYQLYSKGMYISHRDFPMDYLRMNDFIDAGFTIPQLKPNPQQDPPCTRKSKY
ncbi:unnamed protein product [Lymnaea stagnalis]|uniref:Thioredoxin domain-containing protein n=1 Tax=Lymnaea stagnalis TaxID=6523 RepID=A0AAV2HNR8_LYMST